MTLNVFKENVSRLAKRYGPQVFDSEFQKLLWTEVRDLPDQNFKRMVDLMIGEFPNPAWPPKMSDFRDFSNAQRQELRAVETARAAQNWNHQVESREGTREGLNKALKDLGAKSLMEAITKKVPHESELMKIPAYRSKGGSGAK